MTIATDPFPDISPAADPANERLINLLGAAALGLTDSIRAACRRAISYDGAAAAALAMIGHHPGLTVRDLSRILDLSHPGTVRLLDNLEADGLVERRRSARDARAVELYLTTAGDDRRRRLMAERREPLAAAIESLAPSQKAQLEGILDTILTRLSQTVADGETICRLCDEATCGDCPIDRAAAAAEASAPSD